MHTSSEHQIFSIALAAKKKKEKKKLFQGSNSHPAGPHLECAIALYRFSLSDCLTGQLKGVIGLTLQGAAFRCVSQLSEI